MELMDILGKIASGEVSFAVAVSDPETGKDYFFSGGSASSRLGLALMSLNLIENLIEQETDDET